MPDPIVVIGPAAGPAGPIAGSPEAATNAAEPGAEHPEQPARRQRSAGLSVFIRIARGIAVFTAQALWALLSITWRMIRQYPRYSLAAGASFLILGAIAYTQGRPDAKGRASVTNAIGGNLTTSAAGKQADPKGAKLQDDGGGTSAAPVPNTSLAAEPGKIAPDAAGKAPGALPTGTGSARRRGGNAA